MNWNKLKQLDKFTIPKVGEGMAQVFNNLSTPPRYNPAFGTIVDLMEQRNRDKLLLPAANSARAN